MPIFFRYSDKDLFDIKKDMTLDSYLKALVTFACSFSNNLLHGNASIYEKVYI